MIFYFSLSVLFFLNIIICKFSKDKVFKYFMFFVLFLLLFLVSGLRVDIGIDYKNFERDYDDLTINYLKDNFTFFSEPVYLLTCIIFKFCGIPYCGFVFFISFFTLFPIFKISKNSYFSLVLFYILFYQISFCVIQQFWAISISILGIYFYYDKKKFKGILLLFIACLIHLSMYVFFVVFMLAQFCRQKKFIQISSILFFFLYFIFLKTDFIFEKLLPIILKDTAYFSYIGSKYFKEVVGGTGLGVMLRYLFYFILIYLNYKYISVNKIKNTLHLFMCCLILADGLSLRIEIFQRLVYIFYPVLVLIPLYLENTTPKKVIIKNEKLLLLYAAVFIALIISLGLPQTWGNVPYQLLKLL